MTNQDSLSSLTQRPSLKGVAAMALLGVLAAFSLLVLLVWLFPDWNQAGHVLAAQTIADYLQNTAGCSLAP